jgi:hypothetical protein
MTKQTLEEKLAAWDQTDLALTTRALEIWHALDMNEQATIRLLMKGAVARYSSRRLVQLGLVAWVQNGPSGLLALTALGRQITTELDSVADLID